MPPVPKPKRIRNEKLLAEVRRARCCVTGCNRPAQAAHIKSRGSGGGDTPDNVCPLCEYHHISEQHLLGWNEFKRRHPEVASWAELKAAGRVRWYDKGQESD